MALIDLLISPAYADITTAAPGAEGGGGMSFAIMFVVFFLFMYFGIWRPQTKRAKEIRQLMNSLSQGDEVMTGSGILGRINKIVNQHIVVTIAHDVDVVMQKSAVISVLPKGTLKSIQD